MKTIQQHRQLNRLVDEIYCQSDAQGLTRTKLAKRAGLCTSTVSRLGVYKTRFPRAQTVFELARAVGIEIRFGTG